MNVVRNVLLDTKLLPGGGATEIELSSRLMEKSHKIEGVERWPYRAATSALEVIPRTLVQNCGMDIVRTITKLSEKHADPKSYTWGVDGVTGQITDMKELGIWEPLSVKTQAIKTAIESASMILRIDDILSCVNKQNAETPNKTSQ